MRERMSWKEIAAGSVRLLEQETSRVSWEFTEVFG